MIFAIDFDGTIVDHEFPKIGKLKPGAIRVMKRLQEAGHKIIIWTCRKDTDQEYLTDVARFLDSCDFFPDAINCNIDPTLNFADPKVLASFYLDDRNFPPFPGWEDFERSMEQMGIV